MRLHTSIVYMVSVCLDYLYIKCIISVGIQINAAPWDLAIKQTHRDW